MSKEDNTWDQYQIDSLITLRDGGQSWKNISMNIGKTKGACRNKYRREKGIIK